MKRVLVAHRVVKAQERQWDVAEQQWGGGQGSQAIDLALLNKVHIGIIHMERRNGVTCDFDAASCFDCVPNNVMLMSFAKAGTSRNTVNLLGKALTRARYFPTTVFGPSRITNRSTEETPICGSGKGSTDGTAGWKSV